MISTGVPAGATMPCQVSTSNPGNASATGGRSGSAAMRFNVEVASPRNLPDLMNGTGSGMGYSMNCSLPLMTSSTPGPEPLYGTWTALMPAIMLKSSVPRCIEDPLPADGKSSSPGFFLASAISSCVVLTGSDGCTHRISGAAVSIEIGATSFWGSQLNFE